MKLFVLGTLCASAALLTGCVSTIDGRQQAGFPLSKDKITSQYERTPLEIWAAAKEVLTREGKLYGEDTLQSTLEASVDTKTVWVRVEPVDQRVTRVITQVRTKGGSGDIALASEIDKKIALQLVTGNPTPSRANASIQPK